MQTTIYYFSGTGNSLKVAQDLAAGIPGSKLVSVMQALRQEPAVSGAIGIVAPVYMFGLPLIVSDLIKKIKAGPDTYIFTVLTLGGLAGGALDQVKEELSSRGLHLSAGFLVTMPGNYTPLYEAVSADKQKKLFQKEAERIPEIVRIVTGGKEHFDRGFSFLNGLLRLVYKAGSPKIPFLDKEFWVQDSCTSCSVCEKVCPVGNIQMSGNRPRWRHRCQYCFACLHWCPVEAIQHGKKTAGRRRYHHPGIKLEDLINGK